MKKRSFVITACMLFAAMTMSACSIRQMPKKIAKEKISSTDDEEKSKKENTEAGTAKTEKTASAEETSGMIAPLGEYTLGDFGFKILRTLHASGKTNPFISPDSIVSALAMTASGAKGKTLAEMESVLGGEPDKLADQLQDIHKSLNISSAPNDAPHENATTYNSANSIWINNEVQVKKEFIENGKEKYGADIFNEAFDEKTPAKINQWVSEKTNGMIPTIIGKLPNDSMLALVNAVYFEGQWKNPYEEDAVSNGIFHTEDGTERYIKMLNETDFRHPNYMELEGGRGFLKSYVSAGNNLKPAFFAFLPPEGESIDSYMKKLTGESFHKAYENIMKRKVISQIPKFSLDFSEDLSDPLASMGMGLAFSDDAEFPLVSEKPLKISTAIHKTHIDLNENGTKASAITEVGMCEVTSITSEPDQEEKLIFNRPFIYGILDEKTGEPLFLGMIDDIPEEQGEN